MKKLLLLITLFLSTMLSKEIPTYLFSDMQNEKSIKTKLANVGFQVIGSYNAMENKDYKVLIYTSNILKKLATKKDREFAAVGKVLINKKDNILVFTNPEYFLTAFLQKDINKPLVSQIQNRLKAAFKFTPSKYKLDQDDLASYHFMISMPYYKDMIIVAKGNNLNKHLLRHKDKIVFSLKLKESILYGIKMDIKGGEKDYLKILNQEKYSALLPYLVLVSKNEAKILHPKYYLAISLPKLTIGGFMKIRNTPGDIENYYNSLFK